MGTEALGIHGGSGQAHAIGSDGIIDTDVVGQFWAMNMQDMTIRPGIDAANGSNALNQSGKHGLQTSGHNDIIANNRIFYVL